jgi:7-carboxy-7-deazaguanine synthase
MHGDRLPVTPRTWLSVSEVFGPTIQGEGPSSGRPVMFVRLGLCNLDCSWCDTPYTWDWTGKNGVAYDRTKELSKLGVDEIVQRVRDEAPENVRRVVVTGGEPMVQAHGLWSLVVALRSEGWQVEVETNGTLDLPEPLQNDPPQINCSPKLANSGIPYDRRIRPDVLRRLVASGAALKFVVESESDLDEVSEVVTLTDCPADRVWIMPQGTTRGEMLSALPTVFELCSHRGWNLSARLHVLAFNDQRGI